MIATSGSVPTDRPVSSPSFGDRLFRALVPVRPAMTPVLDAPVHYVDVLGVGRLGYYASTAAKGRPIVLVHAIDAAAGSHEMAPLFERLARTRPVYALDLPGFGLSAREDRAYTPDLYARAIARFVRDVVDPRGGEADIVALSLGAELTARAIVLTEDLAHSFVMIAPTGLGAAKRRDRLVAPATRILRAPFVGRALFAALSSRPSIRFYLGKTMRKAVPKRLIDASWRTSHVEGAHHAPLAFLGGGLFDPRALETLYARLACPTLVLRDDDAFVTFERTRELVEANPFVRAATIADSGLAPYDQPDATVAEILNFHEAIERMAPPVDSGDLH